MNDTIFREYDIRGKVGEEFCIENVYNLSRAIAAYLVEKSSNVQTIVVGMDVRTHSAQIAQEVCRGLLDSGLDVVFVGVCTSPMLYFALQTLAVDAGLMVTASHNPKEYNGIKICLGTECLWGTDIQEMKKRYKAGAHIKAFTAGVITNHSLNESYVNWLQGQFSHLIGCPISMVIDCGNGSASVVIHDIVYAMQWPRVWLLYDQPDGTFPHHEADPIVDANMQDVRSALVAHNAQIGIGFDGDADRMGAMTASGQLVPGDQLLAVFAKQMSVTNPHLAVVFDVNASSGLTELLELYGMRPIVSPCGHSIVQAQMIAHNALLGGELSCHFFFNDRGFGFDDGIYAFFRLLEILHTTQKSLDELLADFPSKVSSPQYRLACKEEEKSQLVKTIQDYFKKHEDVELLTIDGIRVTKPYGWGLIRASNTQPAICFRFESDTQEGLNHIKRDFAMALADVYSSNLYTIFGI